MGTKFYEAAAGKYFDDAGVGAIEYKPNTKADDTLSYKYYNKDEVVLGRPMREWLRFSVVYWHTFRGNGLDPFGGPTIIRPWEDGSDSVENAKRRLRVAFEFFKRLGVDYYTFHDRDIAPEQGTLAESNRALDEVTDLALQLQKETGVKLLWATCNLFSHARYMNGAGSNPDVHVLAFAGAAIKKGIDTALKLGAQNFIFWGGREGYQCLLNTDLKQEMSHMAALFRMAVDYKKEIGFTGQLCIEPKAKEPTKHQYDFDAMTVIGFLKTFGLDKDFKLNIEPNHSMLAGHDYLHDICMASALDMLGSIDANAGSPDLMWDTDQFPMDIRQCTLLMKLVVDQGGLSPGGLNFDCKVRRESTDIKDMFISHIGAMDCLARGLRNAEQLINEGVMDRLRKERYLSFESDFGKKVAANKTSLADCEAYVKQNGEPECRSAQQEHYESVLNRYL